MQTIAVDLRLLRDWAMRYPMVTAFCLSLFLHSSFYGFWKWGDYLGWWKHQATWLLDITKHKKPAVSKLPKFLQPKQIQVPVRQEIPLTFLEVDPSTAVKEPPKDAKYYAVKNTVASNPDPIQETTIPKIDGTQNKVPRIENVPKPGPQPLQPALPPEPKPEQPAKPKDLLGDTMFKRPTPDDGTGLKQDRPRRVADVQPPDRRLVGPKLRQVGGVQRRGRFSLDAVESPFAAYDSYIIAAIQKRWYDLIDSAPFAQRTGKVVLEFKLNYDGRITDLKMNDNEVGELLATLCQRAITDPSPYNPWPEDMRKQVGKNYREVLFTFYYE